ncbi:MAG: cytochrome c oxidase subunit 3 family protein [Acidobacteria bacterium]|nr:cytochrome c oxidase subunit 3 family protein [Acidobacteriota bacterium]
MWVFLVTEVLFFGGLFLAYLVYRTWYPATFIEVSQHLDIFWGTTNTAVLITSSLTMALAVYAAETGDRRSLVFFLLATLTLGCVFLGIKALEYSHKFHEHLVPGAAFQWDGDHAERAALFMSLYFIMTGLHALHMIIGVGLMSVMTVLAWRGGFSPEYHVPVEVSGLYWHFVDIVWIFLFPLLYLISRH